MASTLPSPPDSREASPELDSGTSPKERLDGLLEQYLNLLHNYTVLRQALSESFSAGFFSLAQAQRSSTFNRGRRYGEECYDERMKAQKRVMISPHHDALDKEESGAQKTPQYAYTIHHITDAKSAEPEDDMRSGAFLSPRPTEKEDKAIPDSEFDTGNVQVEPVKIQQMAKSTRGDPLLWFGVLVPPALRDTQKQFTTAASEILPTLLHTISAMEGLEGEIRSIRTDLANTAGNDVISE